MVKGKVIQGLQGCDRYREERCFISAYDADTGALAWKFHTVAHSGEPGGDTWNNLPNMMRQGGETWIAQHALLMAIVWPVVLLAIFVPLSVARYRRLGHG